jgi:hypothetical protein
MLAVACGGPRISKQEGAALIESAPAFKSSKVVYVPRIVAIPADGIGSSMATRQGEALTVIEIASVDPVVAVLRARDWVTIEDFVSAVPNSVVEPPKPAEDSTTQQDSSKSSDSTKAQHDSSKAGKDTSRKAPPPAPRLNESHTSPPPAPPLAQAWVHTLRVTPRPHLQSSDLVPDDGEDNPESPRVNYGTRPVSRTPGWTLAVGSRELMRVLEVLPYTPAHGEPRGEIQIDFVWRWRSTKVGAPFDAESAEFQSLPREVQQAALTGSITMDGTTHWSRATLAREGASWKVTNVNWSYGDDKPHNW